MVNINTANFALDYGTTKRSFADRLEDAWITPQDFGAVGNGIADDTLAIQATINFAYGPFGDEHGEHPIASVQPGSGANRVIFFPRGQYKVSNILLFSHVWSITLIGAGQHQVRIFWDPEADPVESSFVPTAFPVIEALTCWHTHMEGMTIDASEVQNAVYHCGTHPSGGGNGDGSDGYYRDVHVTGAVAITGPGGGWGVIYSGAAMGSERTWCKCKFSNCVRGYGIYGGNTINHFFYACDFYDNQWGLYQIGQGGSVSFFFCHSWSNSIIDYYVFGNAVNIMGCYSFSPNFCSADGVINSNTHDSVTVGYFFVNSNNNPLNIPTAARGAIMIGNRSTNGRIDADGGTFHYENPGWMGSPGQFFIGNEFGHPNPYGPSLAHYRGSTYIWEDGVRINPPENGTWNPYDWNANIRGGTLPLSNGNMSVSANVGSSPNNMDIRATSPHHGSESGKWYFEVTVTDVPTNHWAVGIANPTTYIDVEDANSFAGMSDTAGVVLRAVGGNVNNAVYNTGTVYTFTTDPTVANGDVIGVAYDAVIRRVWFRYNGTWLRGNPVTGTDGCPMTGIGLTQGLFPWGGFRPTTVADGILTINLGATAFQSAAPSGFSNWK